MKLWAEIRSKLALVIMQPEPSARISDPIDDQYIQRGFHTAAKSHSHSSFNTMISNFRVIISPSLVGNTV